MSFLPITNNFSTYNFLLFQNFFKQFLPKSNDKRKYSHNEFSYVYKTVTGIFLRYKKMEISEEKMLHCLDTAFILQIIKRFMRKMKIKLLWMKRKIMTSTSALAPMLYWTSKKLPENLLIITILQKLLSSIRWNRKFHIFQAGWYIPPLIDNP